MPPGRDWRRLIDLHRGKPRSARLELNPGTTSARDAAAHHANRVVQAVVRGGTARSARVQVTVAERSPPRYLHAPALSALVFFVALAAVVALWSKIVWTVYFRWGGLFRTVAADWGGYFAQAAALADGKRASIYDLQALGPYRELLAQYSARPDIPTFSVPVSYPAVFAWLVSPLTLVAPPLGFALWSGLNVLVGVWLALRVASLFQARVRPWIVLLVLASFPVVRQFISGQIGIWIACMVTEMYVSLRAGRDTRAGLWLGCLILKPQIAILVGPLLLWKRQWATVAGAAASAIGIIAASILVAGVPGLLSYVSAIGEQGGMRGHPTTAPEVMVNWRAFLLLIKPDIGNRVGIALFGVLACVTVLCVIPALRGRWSPRESAFPLQMSGILVATLLVSFHSHADYITILAFPLAAVFVQSGSSRLTRIGIIGLAIVPTLTELVAALLPPIYFAGLDWLGVAIPYPPLYIALLLFCLFVLTRDALHMRRAAAAAGTT